MFNLKYWLDNLDEAYEHGTNKDFSAYQKMRTKIIDNVVEQAYYNRQVIEEVAERIASELYDQIKRVAEAINEEQ